MKDANAELQRMGMAQGAKSKGRSGGNGGVGLAGLDVAKLPLLRLAPEAIRYFSIQSPIETFLIQ